MAEAPADEDRGRESWLCQCKCGAEVTVLAYNLRDGNTTSCGCVARHKAEEDALRFTDRKAYLQLIWQRYGKLYLPIDEKLMARSIANACDASWTGLRKTRGDQ